MSLRHLRYLKVKHADLMFAMYHLPPEIAVCDDGTELLVTFKNTVLSIRFYKDMDVKDGRIYLRTEIRSKSEYSSPKVFGNVMDVEVKNGDTTAALRAAIEMGRNFDVAQGYETQLIRGNYETYKPLAAPRLKESI